MDEFNYLQFLNDDSELLEAEEVLLGEFPTFSVQFDEYFDKFSSTSAPDACDPESSNKETNPEPTQKVQNVDSTRFPEISSEEIEELKAVAVNKKYLPLDKTVDECIQKLVPVSSSRKCKHRNNGAGRA